MKNKDPQITIAFLVIVVLILGVYGIYKGIEASKLNQDLQTCQVRLGNRYYCEIEGEELRVNSYDEFYQRKMKLWHFPQKEFEKILNQYALRWGDCEVIE